MTHNKNKVIIITGASGSGKTTLVNHLLQFSEFNLQFSISACTRKKRISEVNGKDYHFLSVQEFKTKIIAQDFLEWEEVYKDQFYGTLKDSTERALNLGKNILFDIDVRGANTIKNYFNNQSIGVFIQAPSISVALKRLTKRGTESLASRSIRIQKIEEEMIVGKTMDYQIINDDLNNSKKEIYHLVNRFLKS